MQHKDYSHDSHFLNQKNKTRNGKVTCPRSCGVKRRIRVLQTFTSRAFGLSFEFLLKHISFTIQLPYSSCGSFASSCECKGQGRRKRECVFAEVHRALPTQGVEEAGDLGLVEGSWPVGCSRFWAETQGSRPAWGCREQRSGRGSGLLPRQVALWQQGFRSTARRMRTQEFSSPLPAVREGEAARHGDT